MERRYSDLIKIDTFEGRYNYLRLFGNVGQSTFGFDRYLNQRFYKSQEWKKIRNFVIVRDSGLDLAFPGHEIYDSIYIHHMNPISLDELDKCPEKILDPNFLVCVSFDTHNAIHYGDENLIRKNDIVDRRVGDTIEWKKE